MDSIALYVGLGLALVSVVVVLRDWCNDTAKDNIAADTLKSLRG